MAITIECRTCDKQIGIVGVDERILNQQGINQIAAIIKQMTGRHLLQTGHGPEQLSAICKNNPNLAIAIFKAGPQIEVKITQKSNQ